MTFRLLIVDTYYSQFLRSVYRRHPGLESRPYIEQHSALTGQSFLATGFYASNLRQMGHEAELVIANCEPLQLQWAAENGVPLRSLLSLRNKPWLLKVLAAQVEKVQPDVLYIRDLGFIDASFLREVRRAVGLTVGQGGYPLGFDVGLRAYDLIVSAHPSDVAVFRDSGIPSEYLRLAFEPKILEQLGPCQPCFSTVFIGGYDGSHSSGNRFLEEVARETPVDFWGYGLESLPRDSPIRRNYHGEAWGIEMYRILARSKIVLNRHVAIAGRYAGNMRLYEATGVGTLLLTDAKDNLPELFDMGREVVAYRNAQECIDLAKYYLEHEDERRAIAQAGQRRTLREHTHRQRMEELTQIVERYLRQPARAGQEATSAPGLPVGHPVLPRDRQRSSLLAAIALPLLRLSIRLRAMVVRLLTWQVWRRLGRGEKIRRLRPVVPG